MERVLQTIRKDVAADEIRVDSPKQNLESYFLDVVQKARQREAETSGATSGNVVAAYLRGEAESPASRQDRILERLAAPTAQPEPTPAPEPSAKEMAGQEKLAGLAKPSEPAPAAPKSEPEADQRATLDKANEKLSSLLDKKK
jgi:hypothetical protein